MWKVSMLPRSERKLSKLPLTIKKRIVSAIDKLKQDPFNNSIKIQTMADAWRTRVGDYRIIFRVDKSTRTIFILDVDHRNNIY